jgi:hypothetical protein
MVADDIPAAALTLVGAVGRAPGVTAFDLVDGWPGPIALVATTEKV